MEHQLLGSVPAPGAQDLVGPLLQSFGSGGLQNLIGSFEQAGLGHLVQSWVGGGGNLPVSAEQIGQVLGGSPLVASLAQQAGLSPDQVHGVLAQLLPHAVNHATPDGQVPPPDAPPPDPAALTAKLFGQ